MKWRSILCLAMVPLMMAPDEQPEKLTLGGNGYVRSCEETDDGNDLCWRGRTIFSAVPSSVIEERDGSDTVTRQIVYGGGMATWQLLGDGSSQYLHVDPRGNVVMLSEGAGSPMAAAGDVLERVTYDPYGKPVFQDAANQNKTDGGGNFLAKGDLGNTLLYMGRWYDPETGSRARTLSSDRGGLYDFGGRFLNPDEGRFITRFAEGDPERPVIIGRYGFAGNAPVSRMKGDFSRGHIADRRTTTSGYRETDFNFVSRAVGGPMPQTREHILLARQVGGPTRWPNLTLKRGAAGRSAPGLPVDEPFIFGDEPIADGNTDTSTLTIQIQDAGPINASPVPRAPVPELHVAAGDPNALDQHAECPPWLRARHRMFAIIDRSVPTAGNDDDSSCWIRVGRFPTGKSVVLKGKKILEN